MKKNSKARPTSVRTNAAGRELLAAVRQMHHAVTTGDYSGLTIRTVEILEPSEYDAAAVRALRHRLGTSQAIFAHLMGVSTELVQGWEQGLVSPRAIARRLMDQIKTNPKEFVAKNVRRAG
jgi:putative transcriptional regulator